MFREECIRVRIPSYAGSVSRELYVSGSSKNGTLCYDLYFSVEAVEVKVKVCN